MVNSEETLTEQAEDTYWTKSEQAPTITIAMPTKNRVALIDRTLESVNSQLTLKRKIKIVFLDESDDGTYEKLLEWKRQNEHEYLYIEVLRLDSKGYISKARNYCISNMEGKRYFLLGF